MKQDFQGDNIFGTRETVKDMVQNLIFRPSEICANKRVKLEIVRSVEFSEKFDCVRAYVDVGPTLALGQTARLTCLRPQTVKALGRVKIEIILFHKVWQP